MGIKSVIRSSLPVVDTPVHTIRNYINQPDFPALSIAEITRNHPLDPVAESHEKHYFYYILEGSGNFELNDTSQFLQPGDLFVVPPQSTYRTPKGTRLLCITSPRFEE